MTTDITMFDQAVWADYRTEHDTTERVQMIGSDLSRSVYPSNMLLIERPDGTRRLTAEAWLSPISNTPVSDEPDWDEFYADQAAIEQGAQMDRDFERYGTCNP